MKKNKIILSFICLLASSSVFAELMECYALTAIPGKGAEMWTSINDMAEMQEKSGAVVGIYPVRVGGQSGQINYCLRWDDAPAWAKFADKQYGGIYSTLKKPLEKKSEPTFTMIQSLTLINIDPEVKANDDFTGKLVWHMFSVLPAQGREKDVVGRLTGMKKLIEANGNRVEIYQDGAGGNGSYYFMTVADSWTELVKRWMKTGDTEAWQEFMGAADPTMFAGEGMQTEINGTSLRQPGLPLEGRILGLR